jgi:hypothetical protein
VTPGPVQVAARALLVGDDAEVGSALILHLSSVGWAPFWIPSPDLLETLLPTISPHAIVLVLPASPPASWGAALTSAASAARAGVRVVVVAPSREVVEPLAAVAGAERALSRSDVLARPLSVLDLAPPPRLPPPLPPGARATPTAAGAGARPSQARRPSPTPAPLDLSSTPPPATAHPLPAASDAARHGLSRQPAIDLRDLIDEELVDEPRAGPKLGRVEVNVSLVSEHNFYVGPTRRVDSGGVFVSTMLPPPVGTSLEVRLGLPDARKVDVRGEVVFVRDRSAVRGRQPVGCGIKLVGMPEWAMDVIDRFLAARPPILYSP